jgi:hypothetical protein
MQLKPRRVVARSLVGVAAAAMLATSAGPAGAEGIAPEGFPFTSAGRQQATWLISRAADGGYPNGPSQNAVLSNDKRYVRALAYESDASDIVRGDTNGFRDVFVVRRRSGVNNTGAAWCALPCRVGNDIGDTVLASHGMNGQPANGPSYLPSIDGAFRSVPKCVAFVSAASNLVPGDTNGVADAFVTDLRGGRIRRISTPGNRQARSKTTKVAVSGNCRVFAYVVGGKLYARKGGRHRRLDRPGNESNPSFSTGLRTDLVFAAGPGAYLSRGGTGRPRLVGRGGRNPVYNDIKRQVVAYEKRRGGHTQIAYHDLGRRERIISRRRGRLGNGNSRDPVIGNSGYYVSFESSASNLGVNANNRTGDRNRQVDAYLYTDVRKLTLVQSVREKAVPLPGGGQNPHMSFYANYVTFDSPAPLGAKSGDRQVFMRWLGAL